VLVRLGGEGVCICVGAQMDIGPLTAVQGTSVSYNM